MMNNLIFRALLLFFCVLFNMGLAFFLFSKRKENENAFYLGFVALFSAVYCFIAAVGDFVVMGPYSYPVKLFWNRASWSGVLILSAFLVFIYHFTGRVKHIHLKTLFWYLTSAMITVLAVLTPYFFESLNIEGVTPSLKPGILEPIGRLYVIFAVVVGMIYLMKNYFESKGFQRLQIKYLVIGFMIYSIGGVVFAGLLPLIYHGESFFFADIAAFSSVLWIVLTAYAIVRYRLMDIRVMFGRVLVAFLSLVSALVFASLTNFVRFQLFPPANSFQVLTLIILFSFFLFYLYRFYEALAETYFYPGFSKRKLILSDLENELYGLLEKETLFSLIGDTLKEAFALEKIAIMIKNVGKKDFSLKKISGFKKNQIQKLLETGFFLSFSESFKKPFGLQEILTMFDRLKKSGTVEELDDIKQEFRQSGAEILIPLLFENKVIGVVVLGEKSSGEAYSREDLELLTSFSKQASIALRNTVLYSEVKKRKEDLERFYRMTVDKEVENLKLKKKIRDLEKN